MIHFGLFFGTYNKYINKFAFHLEMYIHRSQGRSTERLVLLIECVYFSNFRSVTTALACEHTTYPKPKHPPRISIQNERDEHTAKTVR